MGEKGDNKTQKEHRQFKKNIYLCSLFLKGETSIQKDATKGQYGKTTFAVNCANYNSIAQFVSADKGTCAR